MAVRSIFAAAKNGSSSLQITLYCMPFAN